MRIFIHSLRITAAEGKSEGDITKGNNLIRRRYKSSLDAKAAEYFTNNLSLDCHSF